MALHNKEDAIGTIIFFYLRKMIKNVGLISWICMKICPVVDSICNFFVKVQSVGWRNDDKMMTKFMMKKMTFQMVTKNENDYVDKKVFSVINYKSRGVRLKGVTIIL